MGAATIWKGVIEFGDVKVPVRFYSAIQDQSVRFNLLHAPDRVPVKQVMVNPDTGDRVSSERIQHGFQVSDDTYVVVSDDEREKLQPEESRTIRIECFVPNQQISEEFYDRAYYLGPDGNAGEYAALVDALAGNTLEGVARWVMRKRSYLGSLQVGQGHLMMISLRYADEVIPAASLPQPAGRELDRKELALAEQLIAALETDFDPSRYRDEHRERLMKFIRAKASGRKPKLRLVRPPKATRQDDLAAVLSASMKALRKERLSA